MSTPFWVSTQIGSLRRQFGMTESQNSHGAILRKFRASKGISRAALAKAVGAHHNQIQKLENNERKLTVEWIERIAPHLGISPSQFLEQLPHGSDDEGGEIAVPYPDNLHIERQEFTPIGRFDASFSMGPGSLIPDDPEPLGYWIFENQWLRALSASAPERLAVVKVDGDSMSPTFHGGDLVLVDRSSTRLNREGIYAIKVGDTAWVKRISLNLQSKKIRVLSDNPLVKDQPELDEEEISVVGRVIALVARKIQ